MTLAAVMDTGWTKQGEHETESERSKKNLQNREKFHKDQKMKTKPSGRTSVDIEILKAIEISEGEKRQKKIKYLTDFGLHVGSRPLWSQNPLQFPFLQPEMDAKGGFLLFVTKAEILSGDLSWLETRLL